MFGAALLGVANTGTNINMPAGIVVINDVAAMTYGYPAAYEAAGGGVAGLRIVRTRGVVQARANGTAAIGVGAYLEGGAGVYNLIVDAANVNIGTFVSLEAYAVAAVAMIWVNCVGVSY